MKVPTFIKKIKEIVSPPGFQYNRFNRRRVKHFIDQWGNNSLIVEIGSLRREFSSRVINVDIKFSPGVDVVANGCYLPFRSETLHAVIARGILEHVSTPLRVVEEIYRSLKNKGMVYLEVPFVQGFHADPGDYQRYTLDGVELLCDKFRKIESGVCGGPASAATWILQEFLAQLFSFGNKSLKGKLNITFGWICIPLKYLDFIMQKNPYALIISSGFYFWGEKSDSAV